MSHPKYKHIGTPAIRTIEECSELIKAISKAERFGYDKVNPLLPIGARVENWIDILDEIDDLRTVLLDYKVFIEQKDWEQE